jgi:N-methylhydantoinase A
MPPERLNASFSPTMTKIQRSLRDAGFAEDDITIVRSVDMRYRYQVHEINVPIPAGTADLTDEDLKTLYNRFDELYETAYGKGSAYRAAGKEIVTLRVTGSGALPKPEILPSESGGKDASIARKGERPVYFEEFGDFVPTVLYDIARMRPGMEISEPGIIETPITTVLINPGDRAVMDEFRNIRISVGTVATLSRRNGDAAAR